ncbi:MAG: PSD1 and planctomycete cytochrome C domain-containing protein [Planctomycetota bacterium]|nr:PSD1 and planctomycete cytochrome C domain-containing protein [Planctomycetota bacterium]
MTTHPWILTLGLAIPLASAHAQSEGAGIEWFENRVRPILAERCYKCHGPKKQKAGLRLDRWSSILEGSETGPVVIPGKPEESKLALAISYSDVDLRMPPKSQLAPKQVADIEKWISMGAPGRPDNDSPAVPAEAFDLQGRIREQWFFQPLKDPATPRVRNPRWPQSRLDHFILASLEGHELQPARPADRRTLIRRLTFDLTGLPPSRGEVEHFLQDDRPQATERLVDRLLESSSFGERWARHWLDIIRYAESRGHEFDHNIANAWQYRDYLIRAFNADLPFDRFVIEQIAGDLLAEPRVHPETGGNESILATGWWYLGEAVHSPVDIRLDECDRIANKIDVLSKGFLGLTVSCARCHDHKFDPITANDYYAMSGFVKSSSYRQVRFETMLHNDGIAKQLDALERDHTPAIAQAVGSALGHDIDSFTEILSAVVKIFRLGPLAGDEATDTREDSDLLFDDFERDTWSPWTTTGDAFGDGPIPTTELPDYQGDVRGHGDHVVNSHHKRNAGKGDDHIGTLSSPEFTIAHDWIHFLIGGGKHAGKTCVELLVDGKAVLSVVGHNHNQMRQTSIDTRKFRGRTAQLRAVDQFREGWGNIGLDHIIFSNSAKTSEDPAKPLAEQEDWLRRIRAIASETGIEETSLRHWAQAIELAADKTEHPLHLLALAMRAGKRANTAIRDLTNRWLRDRAAADATLAQARVLVDFTQIDAEQWMTNGPAFGREPVRPGQIRPGTDRSQPIEYIFDEHAAQTNPAWADLHVAPGTERESEQIGWVQAGRTLRTRSFTLAGGKLHYLVRGNGHVYAAIDSHRMVKGPLHKASLLNISAGDGWRWVTQNLSDYSGHVVHLEFTPRKDGSEPAQDFAIASVIESKKAPPPSHNSHILAIAQRTQGDSVQLIHAYGELLQAAATALRDDLWPSASASKDLARIADWMIHSPDLFPSPGRDDAAAKLSSSYASAYDRLTAKIRQTSLTAPAIMDGSGEDEFLLLRGSPRSPKGRVPRRFLEAIEGIGPSTSTHGSGRLDLAHRMTDPANPQLARTFVNRVWHHLFGRGIAKSVDDLGAMGQTPTHPELLDWLCCRFVEDGWSIKKLIRRIALSKTYAMSSSHSPRGDLVDPDNLLLHRANVRRLQGEAIRDAILTVSGRLDSKQFGPPIPVHLTDFMQGRGRPKGGPLDGAGRRSIYLAVRRNFLPSFFLAFDFPTPSTTNGARHVSNVPAQALALMNSPFVVAEAKRWGAQVAKNNSRGTAERISDLWQAAFARPPSPAEREKASSFLEQQRHRLRANEQDPRSWAELCHVLFNVKEFVYLR